jgi:hypothetical protein
MKAGVPGIHAPSPLTHKCKARNVNDSKDSAPTMDARPATQHLVLNDNIRI